MTGVGAALVGLGAIMVLQAVLWMLSVRRREASIADVFWGLGIVLFAIGFGFEVVGDYQLERFKAVPGNRGQVLGSGLWRYTRHPNYFGDATLWWGIYTVAASTPGGWLTLMSPALMTLLLMRVSGVTLLEDGLTVSKPGYRAY